MSTVGCQVQGRSSSGRTVSLLTEASKVQVWGLRAEGTQGLGFRV